MTAVVWVDPDPHWDESIIREMTAGDGWQHHRHFNPVVDEGAVVVIPGQHHVNDVDRLAAWVETLPWALTIITSDEEALFPVESLPRDARHVVWGQYHARPEFERVIPIGAPPDTEPAWSEDRYIDLYFAGQNTHARRAELVDVMREMATTPGNGNIVWAATTGFRQGQPRDAYLDCLGTTRIAPCPSGPHSLDSFRLYEALAAGALPIVEARTPHDFEGDFWFDLFGERCPLPIVVEWTRSLPILVKHFADEDAWQTKRDEVQAWFKGYREDLEIDFANTISRLRES